MSSQNNQAPSASSSSRKGFSALLQFATSRINLGWLTPFLGKPVLGSGRVATQAAISALSAGTGAKQRKWRASLLSVAFFSVLLSPVLAQAQVCTPGSFTWRVTKFGSHFDDLATVRRLFDGLKAYTNDKDLRMHQPDGADTNDLVIAFSSARPAGSTATLFMENSDAEAMAGGNVTKLAASYQATYRVGGTAPDSTLFALLDRNGNGTIQANDFNPSGGNLNQAAGDISPLGVTLSFYNGNPDAGGTLVTRAYSPILPIQTTVYPFTAASSADFTHIVVQSWADDVGEDPRVIEIEINGTPNNNTNTITTTCLQLRKVWGANAIAGNVASIDATTGGANSTSPFTSTASTTASSTSVAVALGNNITFPAETMSPGTLANYTTVRSCTADGGATTNLLSNTNGQQTGTLLIGTGDLAKLILCTYTNTLNTADLAITKTNTPGVNGNVDQPNDTVTRGLPTEYTIVVTNNGPQSVTGALVTDPAAAGLTCTDLACTGAACPPATPAVSVLQAGLTLGTLAVGNAVTLKLKCNVN